MDARPKTDTRLRKLAKVAWYWFKRLVEGPQNPEVEACIRYMTMHATPADWKMLSSPYDDTLPLPEDAKTALNINNPRLLELRESYARLNLPMTTPDRPWMWSQQHLDKNLNLFYFRGHSPYVWRYSEWPRAMRLKFFIYAQYVQARDNHGLLSKLGEDGAFGCWTYDYPGYGRFSRDLLDAVNEILFLDRQIGLLKMSGLRVLDIGAGYGRLAHRMLQAIPDIVDYCCVDAIPESTFLCEYYLRYRSCLPPARVVPLHELDSALKVDGFDLAINIHSFSECTYEAVAWWMERLAALHVKNLLIVPNDANDFLTTETNGSKRDFRSLIDAAGYELLAHEPVLNDPTISQLVGVSDVFYLFQLKT